MTTEELDSRIEKLATDSIGFDEVLYDSIKGLLSDCIEAVKPERELAPGGEGSTAHQAFNIAIDELERKAKELGL